MKAIIRPKQARENPSLSLVWSLFGAGAVCMRVVLGPMIMLYDNVQLSSATLGEDPLAKVGLSQRPDFLLAADAS